MEKFVKYSELPERMRRAHSHYGRAIISSEEFVSEMCEVLHLLRRRDTLTADVNVFKAKLIYAQDALADVDEQLSL